MARTTVEDCMQQCDNRFNLAYHLSLRARDIQRKGDQLVDIRDDKALVVALREIKDGLHKVPPLSG
ncbi:MAG: DNA-directed RNA polymerase subunit omega [Gammaproteobacteria bacterium]